ncbi:hypothetical protein KOW79_006519 [Hemibagrus wyckioides]|uniref:Uncharacterized protein n=1 Tax=Hemibagrus wyckioides TaxID=337641 RepID=A0A9D3NXJ0_9TELE|nr:hypothetical protein KOW79_006519 [Hemibagrus wyckioides]
MIGFSVIDQLFRICGTGPTDRCISHRGSLRFISDPVHSDKRKLTYHYLSIEELWFLSDQQWLKPTEKIFTTALED